MGLEKMSIKKCYYYVICALTFFILMWGAIDVVSSLVSVVVFRPPQLAAESPTSSKDAYSSESKGAGEPYIDEYYQNRMIFDRLGDSIARILVSGAIFAYFSFRLKEMEKAEKI